MCKSGRMESKATVFLSGCRSLTRSTSYQGVMAPVQQTLRTPGEWGLEDGEPGNQELKNSRKIKVSILLVYVRSY